MAAAPSTSHGLVRAGRVEAAGARQSAPRWERLWERLWERWRLSLRGEADRVEAAAACQLAPRWERLWER